jgi:hypothetical protein
LFGKLFGKNWILGGGGWKIVRQGFTGGINILAKQFFGLAMVWLLLKYY